MRHVSPFVAKKNSYFITDFVSYIKREVTKNYWTHIKGDNSDLFIGEFMVLATITEEHINHHFPHFLAMVELNLRETTT